MSISSTVSFTATGGSTTFSGVNATATGTSGTQISVEVPASTTDQAFAVTVDFSEIESIFLYTDGALTVETNSSSAPDQTFTFVADMPLVWVNTMPTANPITDDITVLYLTNAGGSAVNLYGFVNQSI